MRNGRFTGTVCAGEIRQRSDLIFCRVGWRVRQRDTSAVALCVDGVDTKEPVLTNEVLEERA